MYLKQLIQKGSPCTQWSSGSSKTSNFNEREIVAVKKLADENLSLGLKILLNKDYNAEDKKIFPQKQS